MTGKEALKAWTKAKPLLLTDTGVSEILRTLPQDMTKTVDLALLEKVADQLDDKLAEKKIKAEKKAVAGLKEIQETIRKNVEHVRNDRKAVIEVLKSIHAIGETYLKSVEKGKLTVKAVSSFGPDCAAHAKRVDQITSRGRDASAAPTDLMADYRASYDNLIGISGTMVGILEDAMSKQPKRDAEAIKADYSAAWKKFEKELGELKPVWQKLERL